jgi:hypothetical protein
MTSETGFLKKMSEQAERARPKTRLDVAKDIRDRVAKVAEVMQGVPDESWDEVLGEGAGAFFDKYWAEAILDGMVKGTITVGDPRLADELWRLESATRSVRLEQAKQSFRRLLADEPEIEKRVQELQDARFGIEYITREAIEAGLTTPGQDLSAGQGKGWAAHVS